MLAFTLLLLAGYSAAKYYFSPSADLKKYQSYFQKYNTRPNYHTSFTFLGNTTLLIEGDSTKILIDPFVTRPNIWKIGFSKIASSSTTVKKVVEKYRLQDLNALFCSHGHYDHAFDVGTFAEQTSAEVYGTKTILNIARGSQVRPDRLHRMDGDTSVSIGAFKVRIIPSRHSKPTFVNNDLGEVLDKPLLQPAYFRDFKEGGSNDFLLEHRGLKILFRASYNFVPHQLDHVKADILFLGITGLGKASDKEKEAFYEQTIAKVQAKIVVPIHWDNFFVDLNQATQPIFRVADHCDKAFDFLIEKSKKDHFQLLLMDKFQTLKY